MTPFTERVILIIKNIPSGKVMSYGQIAALAGSPKGARQVVRILHSMSDKYNLPWHRVINSKGEIGFKDLNSFTLQKLFLTDEGIEFIDDNKIDLNRFRFNPKVK